MTYPDWLRTLEHDGPGASVTDYPRAVPPADGSGRRAAVLILLGDSPAGPSVLLLERAETMRQHAGQIAFPGGAHDPGDADDVATALREAVEEVGLRPDTVDVMGTLQPLYLFVTGFVVTPVLAYWRAPHPVAAVDRAEVAAVAFVPVSELAEPANRFSVVTSHGSTPGFVARGLFVWGFTALLLQTVLRLGGWERPWDPSVVRPLPPGAMRSEPSGGAGTFEP